MIKYCVVTPPVGYTDIIVDGQGPWIEESETINIIAKNRRDAVILGVHVMSKDHNYQYCRDQRADNASPYTGVRAFEI